MSAMPFDYKHLLEKFLAESMTVDEFQSAFLAQFKDEEQLDERVYEILDELFGDIDSFTRDSSLLASSPSFYLDEQQLRKKVQMALSRLDCLR